MLTRDDLEQIGQVVDERLDIKLEEKFEEKLGPIRKDIKSLRRKINKMDKTLDIVARDYDERDVALHKRVTKIEDHLGFGDN